MSRPAQQSTPASSDPAGDDLTHEWVGAATVDLDDKVAKHANLRLSFHASDGQRIDVLEVYCKKCRRPYEDVADAPCEEKINNSHLIGGDLSVRAKRKRTVIPPGAERVAGTPINRVGIEALVLGP